MSVDLSSSRDLSDSKPFPDDNHGKQGSSPAEGAAGSGAIVDSSAVLLVDNQYEDSVISKFCESKRDSVMEGASEESSVAVQPRTDSGTDVANPFESLPTKANELYTVKPSSMHSQDERTVESVDTTPLSREGSNQKEKEPKTSEDHTIAMVQFTKLESPTCVSSDAAGGGIQNTAAKSHAKRSERGGHVSIRAPEDPEKKHSSSSARPKNISFNEEDLRKLLDACTSHSQRKRLKKHFRKFKDRNEKLQVLEQTANALKVRNDNLESVVLEGTLVVRESVRRQSGSSSVLFVQSHSTRPALPEMKSSKSSVNLVDPHTLVQEFITPLVFPGKSQRRGRSIADLVGLNSDSPVPHISPFNDDDETGSSRTGASSHSQRKSRLLEDSISSGDGNGSDDLDGGDENFAPPAEDAPAESLAFTPMDAFFGASSNRSGTDSKKVDDGRISPQSDGLQTPSRDGLNLSPPAIHLQQSEELTAIKKLDVSEPTGGAGVPLPHHIPTSPITPMKAARGARKTNSPAVSAKPTPGFAPVPATPPLLATLSPHIRQQYVGKGTEEVEETQSGKPAVDLSVEDDASRTALSDIPKPPVSHLQLSRKTSAESLSVKSSSPLPPRNSIPPLMSSAEDVTLVCLLMLSTLSKQHYDMIHSLVHTLDGNDSHLGVSHDRLADPNEVHSSSNSDAKTIPSAGNGKRTRLMMNHHGWWFSVPITGSVYSDGFNLNDHATGTNNNNRSSLTGSAVDLTIMKAMRSPRPSLQISNLSSVARALVMSWQRAEDNKQAGQPLETNSVFKQSGRQSSPSPLLSLSWSKLLLPIVDENGSPERHTEAFLSQLSLGSKMCDVLARIAGTVCVPFSSLVESTTHHGGRSTAITSPTSVLPSLPSSAVSSPLRADASSSRKPKQGNGDSFLPEIPTASSAISPVTKGKRQPPVLPTTGKLKGAIGNRSGNSTRGNRSRKGSLIAGSQSRGASANMRGTESAADAKALENQEKLEWFTAAENLFQVVEVAVSQSFPVVLETSDPDGHSQKASSSNILQSLLPPSVSNPVVQILPPPMKDGHAFWIVGTYRGNLAESGPRYASSTRASESITDANTRWVCVCDVQSAAASISHTKVTATHLPQAPTQTTMHKGTPSKPPSSATSAAGNRDSAREQIPAWRFMKASGANRSANAKGSKKDSNEDTSPSAWKSSKTQMVPQIVSSTTTGPSFSSRRTSLNSSQASISCTTGKASQVLGLIDGKEGATARFKPSPATLPRYALFWVRWSDFVRLDHARAAVMNPNSYSLPCAIPCHPSWWDMRVKGFMREAGSGVSPSLKGGADSGVPFLLLPSVALEITVNRSTTVYATLHMHHKGSNKGNNDETETEISSDEKKNLNTTGKGTDGVVPVIHIPGKRGSNAERVSPYPSFSLVCTECQGGHKQILYGQDNSEGGRGDFQEMNSTVNDYRIQADGSVIVTAGRGLLLTPERSPYYIFPQMQSFSPAVARSKGQKKDDLPKSTSGAANDHSADGDVEGRNESTEWSYVLGLQVDYDTVSTHPRQEKQNGFTSSVARKDRVFVDTKGTLPLLSPSTSPTSTGKPKKGTRAQQKGVNTAPNSAMLRHGGSASSGLNGSLKKSKDEKTPRKRGQDKNAGTPSSAHATPSTDVAKGPTIDAVSAFGTPLTADSENLSTTANSEAFATPFALREQSEAAKRSSLELTVHFKNIDKSAIFIHGTREFLATSACVKPIDTTYQIKSPDGTLLSGSGNSLS